MSRIDCYYYDFLVTTSEILTNKIPYDIRYLLMNTEYSKNFIYLCVALFIARAFFPIYLKQCTIRALIIILAIPHLDGFCPFDFLLKLENSIHQRFGRWWTSGHININGNDSITSADN